MRKTIPMKNPMKNNELWDRLSPLVTDSAKLELLACACDAWSKIKEAGELIKRDGLVVQGLHSKKEHPAVNVQCKYTNLFQRLIKQLDLDKQAADIVEEI